MSRDKSLMFKVEKYQIDTSNDAEVLDILLNVKANLSMEGIELDNKDLSLIESCLKDKISFEKAVSKIIKEYTK